MPGGGVFDDLGKVYDQLLRHEGDIMGAGHMTVGIKAAGIDEVGVLHAQFGSPLIHELYEAILTAAYVFRCSNGCIVAGGDAHAFDKVSQADLLAFFQ